MQADDLSQQITHDLTAAIEAGTDTWRMPWHCLGTLRTPISVDGRPYRGLNTLVLAMTAATREWSSGVWGTYRGWKRNDCEVRRGETATRVVLWKETRRKANDDNNGSGNGEDSSKRRSLFATTFSVFAAEQVDGAEALTVRNAQPGDTRVLFPKTSAAYTNTNATYTYTAPSPPTELRQTATDNVAS
jgi:antirestriction protein ArdC